MKFKDIPGAETAKAQLITMAKSGRVPHAQLFYGEMGSAVLPMAIAFARYVNCDNPGEEDACGICSSCSKMDKLMHPDVHYSFPFFSMKDKIWKSDQHITEFRSSFLENPYFTGEQWKFILKGENKQLNIPKSEIIEIVKKLKLKAFEGKYKVMIIWLPEYLKNEGNRLLKIIEEPPADTLFILVADDLDKILNTIVSRTQLSFIKPVDAEVISNYLQKKADISAKNADDIASIASGNIGAALELSSLEGNNFSDAFFNWTNVCLKGAPEDIFDAANKLAANGREFHKSVFSFGLSFFRSLMLAQQGSFDINRFNERERINAEALIQRVDFDQIVQITEMFNKAHYYVERNVHAKLLFMNLSLRLQQLFKQKPVSV